MESTPANAEPPAALKLQPEAPEVKEGFASDPSGGQLEEVPMSTRSRSWTTVVLSHAWRCEGEMDRVWVPANAASPRQTS